MSDILYQLCQSVVDDLYNLQDTQTQEKPCYSPNVGHQGESSHGEHTPRHLDLGLKNQPDPVIITRWSYSLQLANYVQPGTGYFAFLIKRYASFRLL